MESKIIVNGGNPLSGCPENWEQAKEWEAKANAKKDEYSTEPKWSFDCGFKLDFDGPILRFSSRFYPPKDHYGPTWDGSVSVYVFEKEVMVRKFDCKTFDLLIKEVESFKEHIGKLLISRFA